MGTGSSGDEGIWVTNGAAAGTSEILAGEHGSYGGTYGGLLFTVVGDEALFQARNAAGKQGLWVTNGTAGGTHELHSYAGSFSLAGAMINLPPPPSITAASYAGGGWMVSGTAEAGATIDLFDNGKRLAGPATANANGAWSFETGENDAVLRVFSAKATASDAVSRASASYIEGTPGNDMFNFASAAALVAAAAVDGDGGNDTVRITAAATLTDVDFARLDAIRTLALTGASRLTLGGNAAAAGIAAVTTGTGATSITDSLTGALTVNAGAMKSGEALTLTGSAAASVTVGGNLSAAAYTGALAVTASGKAAQTIRLGWAPVTPNDASAHDLITGFVDAGNGGKFNDVVDLSAIRAITKFEGAPRSLTGTIAAHSVATFFDAADDATLIFANAGATSLSQASASLMEIELAGGDFKLAASNFKLA